MAGEPSSTHAAFLLDLSESGTTEGESGLLLKALRERGIRALTIEDAEELLTPGGDEISRALVTAIKASKIAIVAFSEGYADLSSGRDKVLTYLLDHFESRHIILVYYGDDALSSKYIKEKKLYHVVPKIKAFFRWDYNRDNMDEFNRKIASQASKMLNPAPIHVTDYPVGLQPRLDEVLHAMKESSDRKFLNIGFYGMQGIGKSTLAREVYNSVAHPFEVCCFLDNIRENSKTNGLVGVQKKLLSQISGKKEADIQLENVNDGVSMINDRLCKKDVLLILDDVDSLDQLEALGGGYGWQFNSDSIVIITTRNKHLLTYHRNDMVLYDVPELNDKEALELLSHWAFEHGNVDPRYTDVLNRAKRYASGLPLLLEMIGSYMRGKSVDECEKALSRLERIPYNDIQSIQGALKVSDVPNLGETSFLFLFYENLTEIQDCLGFLDKLRIVDANDKITQVGRVSQEHKMDFQKVMLILVFFASNVGGLLCNALSPPFKSSIRWWTLFKFFPFVVFFLAVVAVIRYIFWRRTISGLIKCCTCFGFFVCISVYSYFYDRAVDGKPGILNMVSNAMFALASLSLSKLFEAGVEAGIFNYYLQCLTIQLLTIDWKMIFVAIIIGVPLFDWHFSVELFLLTRITKWFGTILRCFGLWNQSSSESE